jgi:hypothetical protein
MEQNMTGSVVGVISIVGAWRQGASPGGGATAEDRPDLAADPAGL